MTPGARVQAAVEILDQIVAGKAVEQALTGWARRSRFAGSKDRAAVRDHVFDVVRHMRSYAAVGGIRSGRGLMLGALRTAGTDPDTVFCDQPYAAAPLSPEERGGGRPPEPGAEALDIPDWLWPRFMSSLGDQAKAAARALQSRAPVHLRVNLRKTSVPEAVDSLMQDEIRVTRHPVANTALEVIDGARRVRQSRAYASGLVELQDAASQAVVETLPLSDGMRVLDLCAGGGGKTLAMAAKARIDVFAHDVSSDRMRDLPDRAKRAGTKVKLLETHELAKAAPFDLVLCDVPCSGSGSWRRAPEGKWSLTEERLAALCETQSDILHKAASLVSKNGCVGYVTCSLLDEENHAQIDTFVSDNSGWQVSGKRQWLVQNGCDGFFAALLTRD